MTPALSRCLLCWRHLLGQVAALLASSQRQLSQFTAPQLTRLISGCAELQRRPSDDFVEAMGSEEMDPN